MLSAIVGVLLLSVSIAVVFARGITGPLQRCVRVLRRIDDGDLTARAGLTGADEIGVLATTLDRAAETVAGTVREVRDDASALATEIGEVIGRINDYATTIAAAVEQQTATTGEMGRNVGQAASGSGRIAADITAVARTVQRTTTSATTPDTPLAS